jgi:hypothetical protein
MVLNGLRTLLKPSCLSWRDQFHANTVKLTSVEPPPDGVPRELNALAVSW